ncbi:MAG: hypothetical protein LBJ86_00980 [Spirochaetaceae bacterium]|nr:hypothetical protein [Spirochaetaceae bacterium]
MRNNRPFKLFPLLAVALALLLAAFTKAVEKLGISGRAYHGILRVARTIADLEAADGVGMEHILEAVQYRRQGDDPYDVFSA